MLSTQRRWLIGAKRMPYLADATRDLNEAFTSEQRVVASSLFVSLAVNGLTLVCGCPVLQQRDVNIRE